MPAAGLATQFSRRMLPLAVIAGLALAVVPPLTYHLLAWRSLRAQARIYAGHVATQLREVVLRQPRLWRYNAAKVLQATVLHQGQPDIAAIEIVGCDGRSIYSSRGASSTGVGGPVGESSVEAFGSEVARVRVRIDPAREQHAMGLLTAVSLPLGLLFGLLLFFFPVRVVRRQSERLSGVVDDLYAAQRELEESNAALAARVERAVGEVRRLSGRVVETQEEERARIARDLHDGLGQAIAGLQMELELARERPQERAARIDAAVTQLSDTLGELRRVVRELRPPELSAAALPDALRSYAELFERRSGLTTYFRLHGDASCSEATAICLLRLLQQALINVAQHAVASEVAVRLTLEAPWATLEVEDDGRGFDASLATTGSGLRGMRERCELLGGDFQLASTLGEGTRLVMRVPLVEAAA